MPPRKETSEQSAARFLRGRKAKARLDPEVAAHHGWRPPRPRKPKPWLKVPEPWQFVERHFPGAYAAWAAGPNAPAADFVIGLTGKPRYAAATGRWWYDGKHQERRSFVLLDDRWIQRASGASSG